MDPVLTDCYVWLYDQAEYVAMALHTWHQLGQVSTHPTSTALHLSHRHIGLGLGRHAACVCVCGAMETVASPFPEGWGKGTGTGHESSPTHL
jgi:hypothetical protein